MSCLLLLYYMQRLFSNNYKSVLSLYVHNMALFFVFITDEVLYLLPGNIKIAANLLFNTYNLVKMLIAIFLIR